MDHFNVRLKVRLCNKFMQDLIHHDTHTSATVLLLAMMLNTVIMSSVSGVLSSQWVSFCTIELSRGRNMGLREMMSHFNIVYYT